MSDEPRNLTLERINRLMEAMADLTESQTAQNRRMAKQLQQVIDRLDSIDSTLITLSKDMRGLASEQILLGNRIEEAFARALRVNIRLDKMEDQGNDDV